MTENAIVDPTGLNSLFNPIDKKLNEKVGQIVKKYNEIKQKKENRDYPTLSPDIRRCMESLKQAVKYNSIDIRLQIAKIRSDIKFEEIKDSDGNTLLQLALKCGHERIAFKLIHMSKNLDTLLDSHKNNLLHLAAQTNLLKVFKYLYRTLKINLILEKNINEEDALHVALKYGSNETALFILKTRKIKSFSNLSLHENTYLHLAAYGNCGIYVLDYLTSQPFLIKCLNKFNRTPLHEALMQGSENAAEYLIKKGADITKLEIHEENCFHLAARGKCKNIFKHFIPIKNKVNKSSKLGLTPLQIALQEGSMDTVKGIMEYTSTFLTVDVYKNSVFHYIAKNDEVIDALKYIPKESKYNKNKIRANSSGYTPLHLSIKHKSYKAFKEFINISTSTIINQCCEETKNTPLHTAVTVGEWIFVYSLMVAGANVDAKNAEGHTPLHLALLSKNPELAEILLLKNDNLHRHICNEGYRLMHYALHCSLDIVKKVLQAHSKLSYKDINIYTNDTLYHYALKIKNFEIVRFLVDKNIKRKRNRRGIFPIHLAAQSGDVNIFQLLLNILSPEELHRTYERSESILDYACISGNIDIIKTFEKRLSMDRIARELNEKNSTKSLMNVITNNHMNILSYLLSKKSDEKRLNWINKLDKSGFSPLHYAAECGNVEAAKYLINSGAEISIKANRKKLEQTPLHISAINKNLEVVKLLFQNNVDLNERDINGYTALHFAVMSNSEDIVCYLIKNHIDATIKTINQNQTALEIAAELNRVQIMKQLSIHI